MGGLRRFWSGSMVVLAVWVGFAFPIRAELPRNVKLGVGNGIGHWAYSVSAKGDVFAILREREGTALVALPSGTMDLSAILPEDFPTDAPTRGNRIVINPDGRYALSFVRGLVVIRSLPDASVVWKGRLGTDKGPYDGDAYYYRATDRRLVVAKGNYLLTYALTDDSPAQRLSVTNITFAEEGHVRAGNFVQSAAYAADGKTLFAGTMDGDLLAIDLDDETPRLRWRSNVFQNFRSGDFSDEAERYAADLECAEGCQKLIVRSFRGYQVAVVDVTAGKVLGKSSLMKKQSLVGAGQGLFARKWVADDHSRTEFALVNAMLEPIAQVDSPQGWPHFGLKDGFASIVPGGVGVDWTIAFRETRLVMAEAQRRQEAEEAEQKRRAKQQAADAQSERKRVLAMERELAGFRRKLKSGDDSNCGLVVERKGDIVLVETMIGQKWLKVTQLFIQGTRDCMLVNGVLQP